MPERGARASSRDSTGSEMFPTPIDEPVKIRVSARTRRHSAADAAARPSYAEEKRARPHWGFTHMSPAPRFPANFSRPRDPTPLMAHVTHGSCRNARSTCTSGVPGLVLAVFHCCTNNDNSYATTATTTATSANTTSAITTTTTCTTSGTTTSTTNTTTLDLLLDIPYYYIYYILLRTTKHYYMLLHATTCYYVLLHATTCYCMLLHATAWHGMVLYGMVPHRTVPYGAELHRATHQVRRARSRSKPL